MVTRLGKHFITPSELQATAGAAGEYILNDDGKPEESSLQIRRSGEEVPAVMDVAVRHTVAWQKAHSQNDD